MYSRHLTCRHVRTRSRLVVLASREASAYRMQRLQSSCSTAMTTTCIHLRWCGVESPGSGPLVTRQCRGESRAVPIMTSMKKSTTGGGLPRYGRWLLAGHLEELPLAIED